MTSPSRDDDGRNGGRNDGGGGEGAVSSSTNTMAALPPGHHVCHRASGALALFLLLALCIVPALVLVAIETSHGYLLLFLAMALLALGALEWSWLAFRIRRKLLFTLRALDNLIDMQTPAQQPRAQVRLISNSEHIQEELMTRASRSAQISDCSGGHRSVATSAAPDARTAPARTLFAQRKLEMRASQYALAMLAEKTCSGHWVGCAFAIAAVSASAVVAAVYGMERAVFREEQHAIGWHMLVAVTAFGSFAAVFLGCLAPTKLDGIVIAVSMGCFIASSMNTFLMYYAHAIAETELLDPLFIVLVGACAMIVMRVVTSKFVMESLLLVLCDIAGLVVLAAPMLAAADLVDHPGTEQHRDKLALFFLVIVASETGDWIARQLAVRGQPHLSLPLCRRRCDERPSAPLNVLKVGATARSEVVAFVSAVALGALMLPLSLVWAPHSQRVDTAEALVLVLAVMLGQLSRSVVASIKQVAEVSTTGFYLPPDTRVGGVLDRLVVFLVATVVYHPYFKHVVYK